MFERDSFWDAQAEVEEAVGLLRVAADRSPLWRREQEWPRLAALIAERLERFSQAARGRYPWVVESASFMARVLRENPETWTQAQVEAVVQAIDRVLSDPGEWEGSCNLLAQLLAEVGLGRRDAE